jgi:hypothetical protein
LVLSQRVESVMSFRLFVYYCAIAGGWCGFIGWFLGYFLAPPVPSQTEHPFFHSLLRECIQSMFLGFAIAFGLSFLDAAFNLSMRKFGAVFGRVLAALLLGIVAGLFGGLVGGSLFHLVQQIRVPLLADLCMIIGYTIVGTMVGISICSAQLLASLVTRKDFGGAFRKLVKCFLGGTVGGILGGCVATLILVAVRTVSGSSVDHLRSPHGIGFVAIGMCIGLLVGLAQIMLKEAWIKVEAGFRPGREMLISKDKTSIGRAEGSDIALFGDSGVEKAHANIVLDGGRYYLEDLQTPGGSYVNDQKVNGRVPLKTGDLIRLGKSMLRFNERAKRKD